MSGTNRVERAELAILRQRADWLIAESAPLRYLFGNDAWFHDPDYRAASNWLSGFVRRIEATSDGGKKISAAETTQMLALKLPATVSAAIARSMLERWNRSIDYWNAGIFREDQVPAGQSADFIALDILRDLAKDAKEMFAECAAAGFQYPEDALRQAHADLVKFVGEGDGGGVCAHVKIQLDQEAVVTRDAFNATLEIQNDSPGPLENIAIELAIRRRSGEDATQFFGVRAPTLKNLTAIDGAGVISSNATGSASWILIPTTDAVLDTPEEFLVSGVLRYHQGSLDLTVPLAASSITVYPSPSLAVKYFHQRDVFADDPFTVEVEPSIPYSLAVMVQNKGHGVARHVTIQSAQPKIVENEKGLLADFKIIATEVAGKNLDPSLTVDFGQIDPGTNAIGRWLLTSTILGGFIDYSASFEHQDDIGNQKLSLIDGVEIHELIHLVNAPAPFDDGRPDFLVNDVPDLYDVPDTLHLSDGSVVPVSALADATFDHKPAPGNLEVQMTVQAPAGWFYLKVANPGTNQFRLNRVVRSDGLEVFVDENVWTTDHTFLGNARRPLVESMLHLFDYNGGGRYTLYYTNNPDADTVAPMSAVALLPAESSALIPVRWSAEDNAGGSGISFFDIYYSVDDGPFEPWIKETIDRSALFQGALGKTYAFYSVSTDIAGNREAGHLTADARTKVTRSNHAPTLAAIPDQAIQGGATLTLQLAATDPDGDELVYSLNAGAPPGMVIEPYSGNLRWETAEGVDYGAKAITVQVLDNGLPRLGATRTFKVTVNSTNLAPVLSSIGDRNISEGELLAFSAWATDSDSQTLRYQLGSGTPAGASIDAATGLFKWQPTEYQGGTTNLLSIVVADDGVPSLSATQTFKVLVADTLADYVLALETTNVLAAEILELPLRLTSSANLTQLAFELEAIDGHWGTPQLIPTGEEVDNITLEPVAAGHYRIRVDFNAARVFTGTREIGSIRLRTQKTGKSSIARLGLSGLLGQRSNGSLLTNGRGENARVFIIEKEPLLDIDQSIPGGASLVLYGLPGRRYRIQSSAALGKTASWKNEATISLIGTYESFAAPNAVTPNLFIRAASE